MSRENINPNPSIRQLEVYNDFSGGLNSETSNERLKDNEFPTFDNVDLNGRGSARRRYGRDTALTSFPTGTSQGAFFYYRVGQTNPDLVLAISGKLYIVYATPVQVNNETPSGSGTTYTLANPWVAANSTVVKVSGTTQTYVPNPTFAPVVSAITATSSVSIPIGNYTIGYTYTNALGESQISPTTTVSIGLGQQFQVQPIALPTNVTGLKFYISLVQGSSTLGFVQTGNGNITMITSVPASGATQPPAINTATQYSMNYAIGQVTFPTTPSATPSVSYKYELKPLPITNLSGGFQTATQIEAAQYGSVLYIATGTQFCQYDGTTASTVTPYTPTNMEAIYIGLNGLAPNPSAYISDGVQSSGISVAAITTQYAQGAVNQPTTLTAYVNKASSITAVDYQWQYKKSSDTTWTTGLDWAGNTSGANKNWNFTPSSATPYDIQCMARDANATTTVSVEYQLNQFPVGETAQKPPLAVSGIQTCTRIVLHWDRIILAGDTQNPTQMYISDLQNPAYFPEDNAINWDMGRREPITAMVRFRDVLLVFSKTSVQALQGQEPSNYAKTLIHPTYGAIAGWSVQVINDMILFLSSEGVMALQPNMFMTYYNILRMDYPIRSAILADADSNACSMFYDNQYWLCIPSQSLIYRYYFDYKAWVRDTSTKLNCAQMLHYGTLVYNLTQDAKLYKLDKNVYTDAGEIYTMNVTSKFLDFDEVFVQKKLKRMYILAQDYADHNVDLQTTVLADSAIVLTPESGQVFIDSSGNTNWITTTTPNFQFYAGTELGSWILGVSPLGTLEISVQETAVHASKTTRIRIIFQHTEGNQCEIFGFAFQFRLKRLR